MPACSVSPFKLPLFSFVLLQPIQSVIGARDFSPCDPCPSNSAREGGGTSCITSFHRKPSVTYLSIPKQLVIYFLSPKPLDPHAILRPATQDCVCVCVCLHVKPSLLCVPNAPLNEIPSSLTSFPPEIPFSPSPSLSCEIRKHYMLL